MKTSTLLVTIAVLSAVVSPTIRADQSTVLTGKAAMQGWTTDAPGVHRRITVADLPPPFATDSASNFAHLVPPPDGAMPKVPAGFTVERLVGDLNSPRLVRVAPNGDIFIAESFANRIRVLRVPDGASKPERNEIFVNGLDKPFGIAFWPPGPDPKYIYIGNTGSVVRFAYQSGDLHARGSSELIVAKIPSGGRLTGGGHWTRDVVFSRDGSKMFVSVGSHSNVAERLASMIASEERRADVLEFNPDGSGGRIFAAGIRNCVGEAINPTTGDLWCSTNERDGLGDNLPPDYITHVQDGGFYGWPWYYLGNHQDPRHAGEHPELADKVIVPDVLVEAHSASLEMTFYDGRQFPEEYRGDAFAAEHGSWNREHLTGYKVIRAIMRDGKATGEYEDFMTGFITPDGKVWGRPVGVAIAHDGSLIVTEDGNGTVWRVSYTGGKPK